MVITDAHSVYTISGIWTEAIVDENDMVGYVVVPEKRTSKV